MNVSTALRGARFNRTVFAGLVIACTALTAQAGEHVRTTAEPNRVVVDYSDLDLTNQTGLKTLYARLQYAAERACGSAPEKADLHSKASFERCYDRALSEAVVGVDDATLRALHDSRSRKAAVG